MICLSSNLSSTLLSLVILSIHECDSSSFILGKIHPKIPILIHPLYRFLTCQFALSMVLLSTSPLYCKKSNTHPSPTLHSVIHATAQHSSTSVSPVQPSPSIHPSIPHASHYPWVYSSTRRLSLSRGGSVTLVATVLQGVYIFIPTIHPRHIPPVYMFTRSSIFRSTYHPSMSAFIGIRRLSTWHP